MAVGLPEAIYTNSTVDSMEYCQYINPPPTPPAPTPHSIPCPHPFHPVSPFPPPRSCTLHCTLLSLWPVHPLTASDSAVTLSQIGCKKPSSHARRKMRGNSKRQRIGLWTTTKAARFIHQVCLDHNSSS